jgi:hypothetical protein
VLEVLHTALREIMMDIGQKDGGLARSGPKEAAAASCQTVAGPQLSSSNAKEDVISVQQGVHASSSFPAEAEQTQCTQLELVGEVDGGNVPDDAMLSRTKANFIEFVLERMMFGMMQEIVAGATEI